MKKQRELAAIISSLMSEVTVVLLLFLLSFPNFITTTSYSINTNLLLSSPASAVGNLYSSSLLLNLLLFLFNTSDIAASISLLSSQPASPSLLSSSRKRKRKLLQPQHQQQQQQSSSSSSSSSSSPLPPTPPPPSSISNSSNAVLSAPLLLDPDSFKVCFRMNPTTFKWLSGLLEPLLECRDPGGSSLNLSPDIRLGIGLFRLATGSPYPDISRRFGVSPSTCRFCTKQLCRVLCTNFRFWVSFPSTSDLDSVSAAFQSLGGLPNCCGILDCTRFDTLRYGHEKSSIAAQIVVDSSSRILSITTGFRGDKTNSRVLKSSSLYEDILAGHLLNSSPVFLNEVAIPQYLIAGGGGYPLLPWLMVPFTNPMQPSCEDDFNATHRLMRLPALRTLASLRDWGILKCPIEEEINLAVACIGACSILHNVLLMREDYSALSDRVDDYSLQFPNSQHYQDSNLEEGLVEEKAFAIRSALAARARELSGNLNLENEEHK